MIKLKLGQIVNAEAALAKFNQLTNEEKVNFSVAYKLTNLIEKVQPELKDYYEQRDKILNKFGVQKFETRKDEQTGEEIQTPTGQWDIAPENREKFKKYIEQLINFDVELVNVFKFTPVEMESVKGLSSDDIFLLKPFIEQPEQSTETTERHKIEINLDEE
jgi:hypothetical protein